MRIAALSVARPLLEMLASQPFRGRILGRFTQACNLVDPSGRVITLTLPEVGNGPFSIVVGGQPGMFDRLADDQPVIVTSSKLHLGYWQIDLSHTKTWEPRISCPMQLPHLSSDIIRILKVYANWPQPTEVNPFLSNRLAEGAAYLNRLLPESGGQAGRENLARAVSQLAGLGSGLTPAGDDYLVGGMVALWLIRQKAVLAEIARIAAPQTTWLSAAFLLAAARGEFIEPWHNLIQALFAGRAKDVSQAVNRVAQVGASSGRDALAGFVTTLLSLVNLETQV